MIISDKTENKHGTTKKVEGFIIGLKIDSPGVAPVSENGTVHKS